MMINEPTFQIKVDYDESLASLLERAAIAVKKVGDQQVAAVVIAINDPGGDRWFDSQIFFMKDDKDDPNVP